MNINKLPTQLFYFYKYDLETLLYMHILTQ